MRRVDHTSFIISVGMNKDDGKLVNEERDVVKPIAERDVVKPVAERDVVKPVAECMYMHVIIIIIITIWAHIASFIRIFLIQERLFFFFLASEGITPDARVEENIEDPAGRDSAEGNSKDSSGENEIYNYHDCACVHRMLFCIIMCDTEK